MEGNTMAFCGKCGTQLQDGVKFCPACGSPAGENQAERQTARQSPNYAPPVVPGAPALGDIRDANDNKTMAILAYILFFIPLLTGAHKTSPFVKYHTNQGTVLFICAAGYGIASSILSSVFLAISWRLWVIGSVLSWGSVVFAVLCVVGIINAVNGRMKPLPVIGGITIIK
jgi:uncharacterized membrane protein